MTSNSNSNGSSHIRITVNAGGRLYETTAATLRSSGCPLFQELLQPSSHPPKSSSQKSKEKNKESKISARPPRTIFVDGDADLFADVLYFMRRQRLPSAAAATTAAATQEDAHRFRLTDLLHEAEFLEYKALIKECRQSLKSISTSPSPSAQSYAMHVPSNDTVWIHLPENSVLYLVSAVYVMIEDDNRGEEEDRMDSYLSMKCGEMTSSAASYHVRGGGGRTTTTAWSQNNLPICISGSEEYERVGLVSSHGRWDVLCWVGDIAAIPGLNNS
jgi:hypothetical protein